MTKTEHINAFKFYNWIKAYFEANDMQKSWFYQDYFKTIDPTFFLEDLQKNEPWIDLSKDPTEEDFQAVLDSIKDGMENSAFITNQIGCITDKYIGDCSFNKSN